MNRRSLQAAGLAAVGVLALGLGAATLTSTVRRQDEGFGLGGGGGGEQPGIVPPSTPRPSEGATPLDIPEILLAAIVVLGVLLTIWYLVVHLREAATTLGAAAIVIVVAYVVVWLLREVFPPRGALFGGGGGLLPGTEGEFLGGPGSPTQPVLVLMVVLGAVAVGAVVVLARSSDDVEGEGDAVDAPRGPGTASTRAIGRTAGRVADRIDAGAGVDNEVYRAWREMTELLDVAAPESTTSGEFATAATDAGMTADDVDELTRLFEDVRYGRAEADETREDRARRVFRRIERDYAPEG